MKSIYYTALVLLLLGFSTAGNAQAVFSYRVYFNNKAQTPFSLQQPQDFLSQRALDRRIKFGISIDSTDLPVNTVYIDSILSETNAALHLSSRWQNTAVFHFTDSSETGLLSSFDFVDSFRLVGFYPTGLPRPQKTADAPGGRALSDYDANYYGYGWASVNLLNGQVLHERGKTGSGVLIAVLDAGFKGLELSPAFDSLRHSGRLIDRWYFPAQTPASSAEGDHGTRVLSVMAARLPDTLVGTAPEAMYCLYTPEDLGSEQPIEEDNWAAAAERADSLGADIIQSSLGYNTFDPPHTDYTYGELDGRTTFIARSANTAVDKGIAVLVSAGNEGNKPWQFLLTPGDAEKAITVGSVNLNKLPEPHSGRGFPEADSIKPTVCALGMGVPGYTASGMVLGGNGTSFATPAIAGLSACLLQTDPAIDPAALKALLKSVSDHFLNPDRWIGYGVPDFGLAYQQVVAIHEASAQKPELFVYPNPVINGTVHIWLPEAAGWLSLYDLSGRVLLKKAVKSRQITLPVGRFTKGAYFLNLRSNRYNLTEKIVLP